MLFLLPDGGGGGGEFNEDEIGSLKEKGEVALAFPKE